MASAENQKLMSVSVTGLPHDVMVDIIFPRLPAKSLARFKCVCKLWFKAISEASFAKSHLTFQTPGLINITQGSILSFTNSTDTDSSYKLNLSDILGETCLIPIKSCNGLLLVRSLKNLDYYIINPVTGRHINIPPAVDTVSSLSRMASAIRAFSDCFMHYDKVSNEYTLLGWNATTYQSPRTVYGLVINDSHPESEISWRALRKPRNLIMMWYQPAFFKGWYHWIARDMGQNWKRTILALNIESEESRVMSVPDTAEIIPSDGWKYRLAMADGSMYLIQYHRPGRNFCYILWTVEDYEKPIWREVGQYRVEYCQRCKGSGWDIQSSAPSTLFNVKEVIRRGPQRYTNVVHTNSLVWLDTKH